MKIPIKDLTFLVLQQNSDLTSFECIESELNSFLKEDSKIYQKTHMAIRVLEFSKIPFNL